MTKTKTTYSHTTEYGTTATTNSTRTYTHVIVCGEVRDGYLGGYQHNVAAWSGSEAAALRRVAEFTTVFENVRVEAINGGQR